MFSEWRQKRELRRIQSQCPHEWHVVSEYKIANEYYSFDNYCDLYCPSCNKTMNKLSRLKANKIIEMQRVRKEYDER